MSKLEELIEKLCPNGVEYKTLDKVCSVTTGNQLNKDKLLDEAEYPVINGGINPSGYWHEYNTDKNTITISQGGASAGYVNYMETPFWAGAHCYVVKLEEKKVNYRYLYHYIKSIEKKLQKCQQGAGIPSVSRKTIYENCIPVPPLEVQCEIVHILDDFTLLSAELSAELKARQEQFSYYREKLYKSNENIKRLDEVVDIRLGLTHTPKYVENGIKFISAQNTSNDYLNLENVKYISQKEYDSITDNAKPKRGDILFTRVGSNLGHPVIVETDEKLCMFVSLGYLRIKNTNSVLNTYIKHWINTENFWSQVRKNVHGSAKVNLNTGWLSKFEISIPSIEEQQNIVNILDKLEKLCNDISEGLPAEIEARQKQYEYYRDKLLTFKELKVNE